MKGKLYINGIDAFERYGIFIAPGGYNALIQYPVLKKVEVIDWPEEDGVEPDLSDPQLESKEITISFNRILSEYIEELVYILSAEPYHTFFFSELSYTVKLRLVDQSNLRRIKYLDKFTLKFSDDFPPAFPEGFPLEEDINPQKKQSEVRQPDYELDGKMLSDYGIWLLDGSDEELEKSPAVKKNLLVDHIHKPGVSYLGKQVVFQSKDVTLKCLLQTENIEIFWRNYYEFLHDLIQPGERQFYSERLFEAYPCYYKSSSVTKFEILPDGRIWCEFNLTLVFTAFRVNDFLYILASEQNEPILSQDGQYLIDIKRYGNTEEESI